MHYHLIIYIRSRAVIGDIMSEKIECNLKNFPYKCFYSDVRNEIYSFYRQGQAFMVNPEDPSDYKT